MQNFHKIIAGAAGNKIQGNKTAGQAVHDLKKGSVPADAKITVTYIGYLTQTVKPGGVIRLEIYYNAAASVAYAQLFDFSNYSYEPATGIIEVRGRKADKIIGKL